MRTWIIRIVIAVVVVAALVVGGLFVYTTFFHDSEAALTTDDLSEILAGTEPTASEPAASEPSAATTTPPVPIEPAASEPPTSEPPASDVPATDIPATDPPATDVPTTDIPATEAVAGLDGIWEPTDESIFGYRVEEVIAGVNVTATGRSNEIGGALEIDGTTATIDISVLVENIQSDEARRDRAFAGRIMEADDFPEATFMTTTPIDFGVVPSDGEQITTEATGDLTLKDVTQSVTFEVTAEANGERIGVFGNIPVIFEDYGIDNPSFGAIKTEDEGLVEFVLVFE